MGILKGNTPLKAYKGDYKPINIYKGDTKVAGWKNASASGVAMEFDKTYNDVAEVLIEGNTVQSSDYYAKDGLSSQVQTSIGKNILNKNVYSMGTVLSTGNAVSDISFNYLKLSNTNSVLTDSYFIKNYDLNKDKKFSVGKTYTISFDANCPTSTGIIYILNYNAPNFAGGYVVLGGQSFTHGLGKKMNFTINSLTTGEVVLRLGSQNINAFVEVTNLQIEEGIIVSPIYEPFIPNSPSPDYPSTVTSNLPSGTYKYTSTDGIYEFTLADDLRGIDGVVDKVVFDRVSKRGYLEKRIDKKILNGSEGWSFGGNGGANTVCFQVGYANVGGVQWIASCLSEKFPSFPVGTLYNNDVEGTGSDEQYHMLRIRINKSRLSSADTTGFKSWLVSNPTTLYFTLATKSYITTPLTFTKVSSSSKTEVPMTFLTNTPSLNYPADVWSVEGKSITSHNLDNSKSSISTLPNLRKISSVSDSYNPKIGVYTKNISDWVTLDGNLNWSHSGFNGNFKEASVPIFDGVVGSAYVLKYDSTPTVSTNSATGGDTQYLSSMYKKLYQRANNIDSGFSSALNPSSSEWKAYFNGWKMCNADGTSPYYKSEVPYTPSTWAEWIKDSGVVGDSSGLTITSDGVTYVKSVAPSSIVKVSTKYGILYNVISSTLIQNFWIGTASSPFIDSVIPKVIGNNKLILTTQSVIAESKINLHIIPQEPIGNSIKIKDIRVFELPTGSQIETDFNTLTADQLCAKYTFNGLCAKNWVHVTDGLGQTALLPTASYEGYTPYKMLYQLATPTVSNLTPAPLQTFYPYTKIETDAAVCKPTITATVKVEETI